MKDLSSTCLARLDISAASTEEGGRRVVDSVFGSIWTMHFAPTSCSVVVSVSADVYMRDGIPLLINWRTLTTTFTFPLSSPAIVSFMDAGKGSNARSEGAEAVDSKGRNC